MSLLMLCLDRMDRGGIFSIMDIKFEGGEDVVKVATFPFL